MLAAGTLPLVHVVRACSFPNGLSAFLCGARCHAIRPGFFRSLDTA